MTTLPTVAAPRTRRRGSLWLDAHGDFNTPETTPSGFLGGMCLAAACGRWDAGLGDGAARPGARGAWPACATSTPASASSSSARGVGIAPPDELAGRARRATPVYVHLDLDVLDPSVLPAQFPAPGGLSSEGLRDLLGELAERRAIVGVEITAFEAPEDDATRARPARRALRRSSRCVDAKPTVRVLRPLVEELHERRAQARLGGGEEKIATQHAAGQADRARAARAADRRGHVHRARHPRAARTSPSARWRAARRRPTA